MKKRSYYGRPAVDLDGFVSPYEDIAMRRPDAKR